MNAVRPVVLALALSTAFACAKKRDEAPSAPAPYPAGVDPPTKCRFESVMAAGSLEMGAVTTLDLPADPIKDALRCAGGPLAECAGKQPSKSDLPTGAAAFTVSVDGKGFATDVKLGSSSVPPAVTDCATQILKRIDFPQSQKASSTVNLAFTWTKHQDSPRFGGLDISATSGLVDGTLDRADKALDGSIALLRSCYLMALERDDKPAGTIDYTMSVDGTGAVGDLVLIQRGTLPKDTVSCVDTVVRAAKVGTPLGTVRLKGTITMKKHAP